MADQSDQKPKAAAPVDNRAGDPTTGAALRSVYQKTVEEAVPDEMLALLSKLD